MKFAKRSPKPAALLLLIACISGCDTLREVTNSEKVRAAGMIGACYTIKGPLTIVSYAGNEKRFSVFVRPPSRYGLVNRVEPNWKIEGVLDHGSRIRVERVFLFNNGLLPSPALAPSDVPKTYVRVLDGPHRGQLMSLYQDLGLDAYWGAASDVLFEPCNADSDRPH